MSAEFLARILIEPRAVFCKSFRDVLRDRRLTQAERLTVLSQWPCADDFERGEVAAARQELEARLVKGHDNQTPAESSQRAVDL